MKLAIGIEYDGRGYRGWQWQPDGPSIQGALEAAIGLVADHPLQVHGAGRTDAGVHALLQVAHFETAAERAEHNWIFGINRHLPANIAVRFVVEVDDDFHARFSALGRRYRYRVRNHRARPALDDGRVLWVAQALDVSAMARAAQSLLGRNDYSSFRGIECQAAHAVRELRRFDVCEVGDEIWFEVEADGFLHHMVRNLVGTLLEIGRGKRPPTHAKEVLDARDRRLAGMTVAADGLYFVAALYPRRFRLPSAVSLTAAEESQLGPDPRLAIDTSAPKSVG